MEEGKWRACSDPEPMLKYLESIGAASERKLRLFSVACCRRLLSKVPVRPRSELAVDVAERYADGFASDVELTEVCLYANNTAEHACRDVAESEPGIVRADCTALNAAWAIAEYGARPPDHNGLSSVFNAKVQGEQSTQCQALRDIFGNPVRPITFSSEWRTDTATAVARQMYGSREFSAMPILADALQDAGCDSADILNHCRGDGPHVRGCWVVDLVLGKE